jgi:hypothetical protein
MIIKVTVLVSVDEDSAIQSPYLSPNGIPNMVAHEVKSNLESVDYVDSVEVLDYSEE